MHILYGVSATGNGHISRARALIPELEQRGAKITTLFSGSASPIAIDASVFHNVITRAGFARPPQKGEVSIAKAVADNLIRLPKLSSEVLEMDLSGYDLVISDFEPISAFSRRFRNLISGQHKPSVGLAHQYAFEKGAPSVDSLLINNAHSLARAKTRLGMHFHHFGKEGILPPFISDMPEPREPVEGKILVYLGFDDTEDVVNWLKPYTDHNFHIYSKQASELTVDGHISIKPIDREGFRNDFADCEGVITGAGFMAPSEALHMGKKLLVKPVMFHPEQQSNALALKTMNAGMVMHGLDPKVLEEFLEDSKKIQITYPDTISAVADWLIAGDYSRESANNLCYEQWEETEMSADLEETLSF